MATELEAMKKELEKQKKAMADTQAAYTKGQQALAAAKAELSVLDEVGVRVPTEIADLKTDNPEKYAAELEKFNRTLADSRESKAKEATEQFLVASMNDVAKKFNLTPADVQENVPPAVYNAYKEGNLSAENVAMLAAQYKSGKTTVVSPTTQKEFDFSSVAGGLTIEATPEKDDTLNEKDYIG